MNRQQARVLHAGRKPRRAPKDIPDSLPERDRGTDVAPDDVRDVEPASRAPPDSLPREVEDLTRP